MAELARRITKSGAASLVAGLLFAAHPIHVEAVANIVAKTGRTLQEAHAELASRNPQKRLVRPEEVANAVVWLCLPGSEAITGQAIAVAGGEVM